MITSPLLNTFLDVVSGVRASPRRVLEMGSKRSGNTPTIRREAILASVPECEFVGTDCQAGEDVDIVADAHTISSLYQPGHFAGVLCENVLEHCRRPWVVAEQLSRLVISGGYVLASAPFALAHHAYPDDYWRFTEDALEILFEPWFHTITKGRMIPAIVVPTHNEIVQFGEWNYEGKAWLMSYGLFRRKK